MSIKQDFDRLKLEREAEKYRTDNEYLIAQRDALKAEVNEAWQAAQDAGLRADRNSDYVARLHIERDALRAALEEALPIVEYVSRGRRFVDVEVYPDATARMANFEARAALKELEEK